MQSLVDHWMVLSTEKTKYDLYFTKVTSPALQRMKWLWIWWVLASVGVKVLLWSQLKKMVIGLISGSSGGFSDKLFDSDFET